MINPAPYCDTIEAQVSWIEVACKGGVNGPEPTLVANTSNDWFQPFYDLAA